LVPQFRRSGHEACGLPPPGHAKSRKLLIPGRNFNRRSSRF
jgi:hypothetical protein